MLGGSAEWKPFKTVELTENTYSVSFDFSDVDEVHEVFVYCSTKQNRTDQDVTSFQNARFVVNDNNTAGYVSNFSSHINYYRYVDAFVKFGIVAGYATVEVSVEGTDSNVSKSIFGTSYLNVVDRINNVKIAANYVYVNGAVVNGFVEGSTFKCYYR